MFPSGARRKNQPKLSPAQMISLSKSTLAAEISAYGLGRSSTMKATSVPVVAWTVLFAVVFGLVILGQRKVKAE